MKSIVTKRFWKHFDGPPKDVQDQATSAFQTWSRDPHQSGLSFKRLDPIKWYSVRIGRHYRALCYVSEPETYVWDWIGSHSDYDKEVSRLR